MPHFQLVMADGTALGARHLGRPDWPPGSVIYTGPDEPNLRVVRERQSGPSRRRSPRRAPPRKSQATTIETAAPKP